MPWISDPLDLPQQVAQMIIVPASAQLDGSDPSALWPTLQPEKLQSLVQELGIGGIWVDQGHVAEAFLKIQQWQAWAPLPLLVGASCEWGVGQHFRGATEFPPPYCLHLLGQAGQKWAREMGRISAREASALGLNWLMAPVVEVPADASDPVLDLRSFGSDPQQVGQLIRAFIAGTQSEPVLTTARHFPGYGLLNSTDKGRGRESAPEAHSSLPTAPRQLLLPRLQRTRAELGSWEWIPFQQAIAAGAQMIMTAHVLVPDLDPQWPATLSEVILQKILREQWQFQGLIVSDALHWGVLSSQYAPSEIAVRAVQAGVDLLLAPPQPEQAIQSICQAVERGQISRWRIEQSVTRILRAKQKVCPAATYHLQACWPQLLQDSTPADLPARSTSTTDPTAGRGILPDPVKEVLLSDPIPKKSPLSKMIPTIPPAGSADVTMLQAKVGLAEAQACVTALAKGSIQRGSLEDLPLQPQPGWLNWIWVSDSLCSPFLSPETPAIASASAHQVPTWVTDPLTPLPILEQTLQQATGLIVHWFFDPLPYRAHSSIPALLHHLLREHRERIQAVACYGSISLMPRIHALLQQSERSIPWFSAVDRRSAAQQEIAQLLFGYPHQVLSLPTSFEQTS